jgi:hypothetical protein
MNTRVRWRAERDKQLRCKPNHAKSPCLCIEVMGNDPYSHCLHLELASLGGGFEYYV